MSCSSLAFVVCFVSARLSLLDSLARFNTVLLMAKNTKGLTSVSTLAKKLEVMKSLLGTGREKIVMKDRRAYGVQTSRKNAQCRMHT